MGLAFDDCKSVYKLTLAIQAFMAHTFNGATAASITMDALMACCDLRRWRPSKVQKPAGLVVEIFPSWYHDREENMGNVMHATLVGVGNARVAKIIVCQRRWSEG